MRKKRKAPSVKNILITAMILLLTAVYLVFLYWLNHTERKFWLGGCIWKPNDMNQILLVVLWLIVLFDNLRIARKTEDQKRRAARIRYCKFFGAAVCVLAVCLVLSIVTNYMSCKKSSYAVLKADSLRGLLLTEDSYGGRIQVYTKKGCVIRQTDEVNMLLYANMHCVANEQYTWETDGRTVTIRFQTGGYREEIQPDENSEDPIPPAFVVRKYDLPETSDQVSPDDD